MLYYLCSKNKSTYFIRKIRDLCSTQL